MPHHHAGYVDIHSAQRLANTINTIKTVLIALIVIGPLAGAIALGTSTAVVIVLYGAVTAVAVYVLFGWFEHTLRLLIGIAFNTAEGADLIEHDSD